MPFQDEIFQQEVLDMLEPKIKSVLYQTTIQNREDLRQTIYLKIIEVLREKEFNKSPSFFELLRLEDYINLESFKKKTWLLYILKGTIKWIKMNVKKTLKQWLVLSYQLFTNRFIVSRTYDAAFRWRCFLKVK